MKLSATLRFATALACVAMAPPGVAVGSQFQINAGLNDAWYESSTNGQGFFVTVFPDSQKVFLSWFTYDLERPADGVTAELGEPGHRWLTALGPYTGDTATLDIELTQGGIFDSPTPAVVQTPAYGTVILRFSNCAEGEVEYTIPSVGRSGTIPIRRTYASPDNMALCETLQIP